MANIERNTQTGPTHVPFEIFTLILDHVSTKHQPRSKYYQRWLNSTCLVSRSWYYNVVGTLYRRPVLDRYNFARFVESIVRARGPLRPLAELVRTLDLSMLCDNKLVHNKIVHTKAVQDKLINSKLVHNRTDSLTMKALGAMQGNLECFVAPRAGLTVNLFPALSRCCRIHKLDFSHVSEVVSLAHLLRLLTQAPGLVEVRFPKVCTSLPFIGDPSEGPTFSQSLQTLHMGELSWAAYQPLGRLWAGNPSSLTSLTVNQLLSECKEEFRGLLASVSTRLLDLTLTSRMGNGVAVSSWDFLLDTCPSLQRLSLPAAFIGHEFATPPADGPYQHPLRVLELTSSGRRDEVHGLSRLDIAQTSKAFLRNLRELRVQSEVCRQGDSYSIVRLLQSQVSAGYLQATLIQHVWAGHSRHFIGPHGPGHLTIICQYH